MIHERTGMVKFGGNPLTLQGNPVSPGAMAPDFTVLANDLTPRTLADYQGKVLLISTVPSIDTGICDIQTRKFNAEVTALGSNVNVLTISCDLPFAQGRWCGAAGIDAAHTLSDHKDLSFGLAYGLVLKELRLLTRAVLVVNAKGVVVYEQIVPEIKTEVNYDLAHAAVRGCV